MASDESGNNRRYAIEFPEMPGVVFVVNENDKRTRRDGRLMAEWMARVAAEIWFRRDEADRQRVMDEVKRGLQQIGHRQVP